MSYLKVGAGKACIDPPDEMYPMPTHFNVCQAKYDSCYVRALAIDNGSKKLMFVVYELSDMPTIPDLKKQIAEAVDFPEENIVLAVTHNHSSPCDVGFNDDEERLAKRAKYKEIEVAQAIEAAKAAVASMRPAKYGYGEIDSYTNTNRDLQTPFGYWVEGRNLAGYSCKTLATVKFVDEEGKIIAVLLNHETHATCAFLQKDADGLCKTSGNFPGIACRFVEEHYGDGVIALWTAGCSGNQNPLLSHGMQYEYPDGYSTGVNYPDGVSYMQMEFMGRYHGADCVKGIDAITKYSENMPIVHVKGDVDLPAQKRAKPGPRGAFRMGGNGLRQEGDMPVMPDIPEMVDDPEHPQNVKMQLIMLGDIAVLCAGAEVYAQIGRDMKEASPFKKTFVITHTEEHVGYILDKSSKDSKVFQAFGNVKPGCSDELLVGCEMELFDKALDR